jgi:hypothetical protein
MVHLCFLQYFFTPRLMRKAMIGLPTMVSSVIASKAANGYQFKTGQWKTPGTQLFYPASSQPGKS